VKLLIPSARTVHGLTPAPEVRSSASPRPNKAKPKHKTTTDTKGGRNVSGLGELQKTFGTFRITKNFKFNENNLIFLISDNSLSVIRLITSEDKTPRFKNEELNVAIASNF
jgi:hypothetical protein